ncbi:PGA61 Probable cell wall protein PGA61 [Candida maltosa Xu316]
MKSALLLALLPVAFAVKREQTSCNAACTQVLEKQQQACPTGSDSSCLCGLSDEDYWEPLANCDCINPDNKFSASDIKGQICGVEVASSSEEKTTSTTSSSSSSSSSSTSTESSTTEESSTEEPVAKVAQTETVAGEAETATVTAAAETAATEPAAAASAAPEPVTEATTPEIVALTPAAPLIQAQPSLFNGSDVNQVSVQAFDNGAPRVGIAVGSLFALALNFI